MIFLIVMVYSRASTSTLALLLQVFGCVPCFILLEMPTGNLSSAVIYFTLESEANEDPPEFTLTCQSRGGPVTEVEWRRDGVRVEKDSNHMTSQVIVDTLSKTVYNNTLRVRGREGGHYICVVLAITDMNMSKVPQSLVLQPLKEFTRVSSRGKQCHLLNFISVPQKPTSLKATYTRHLYTSISLEWAFNITLSLDYGYMVYYQSGGVSYSVAFTTDSSHSYTHELTGLPVGGIHSVSLVALIYRST